MIHANKNPTNAHRSRFKALTTNEGALMIVGQEFEFEKRDIMFHNMDTKLAPISDCNVFQHSLMFCRGEVRLLN